jgi:hypothetical protein
MMNPMSMMSMMSQMMPPHGWHHGLHVVEGYFKKLADGPVESVPAEIKAVLLGVVKEYMDAVMARHGYMTEGGAACNPCGYDKELHKAFKETIEEMRELNSSQVPAFIDNHFEGLSSGERRVLMAQANMPSKRKRAENINMSKEHFMELNHSAATKLKRK